MTVEFWTFARENADEGAYNTYGNEVLVRIGRRGHYMSPSVPWAVDVNLAIGLNTSSDSPFIGVSFDFNNAFAIGSGFMIFTLYENDLSELFGEQVTLSSWATGWHHYAICIDIDYMYFFIDGHKAGQKSMSDEITVVSSGAPIIITQTVGEFIAALRDSIEIKGINANQSSWDGGYAQIAACNDCKWTGDFTPPPKAYFAKPKGPVAVGGADQLYARQVKKLAPAGVLGLVGAAIQFADGSLMGDAENRLMMMVADDSTVSRSMVLVDNNNTPIVTPQGVPLRAVTKGVTVPKVEVNMGGQYYDGVRVKDLPSAQNDEGFIVRDSESGGTVKADKIDSATIDELWDSTEPENENG